MRPRTFCAPLFPHFAIACNRRQPKMNSRPAIWFPTVRTGTGTDVFTERLVAALQQSGLRAEITWLPLRAEYAPWTVAVPQAPEWATVAHVNTWLHTRFIPSHLPVVATVHHAVHHPDAHAYKGPLRAAYHRWWIAPNERRVLRRASQHGAVIAVSQFVADSARASLLDVPMQVIYNGVDTEVFRPGLRKRQTDESFKLLFVGSWMARKGVDLLAPIMHELGAGFVLHYTGGPAAQRDKAHLPPNMIDIGRLDGDAAVAAAMQDADALLFPSRSEGFGLVAAEAMACSLPVVTARSASLVEVVAHGQTGELCLPNDVSGFVSAVQRLAADRARHENLRSLARVRVMQNFSESTMVQAYEALYRRLSRSISAT